MVEVGFLGCYDVINVVDSVVVVVINVGRDYIDGIGDW